MCSLGSAYVVEKRVPLRWESSLTPLNHLRRWRDELKLSQATDFHSLCRTFITMMENAQVQRWALMSHVGHKPAGMTFGTYSATASQVTMVETAKAVWCAREVEAEVGKFLTGKTDRQSQHGAGSP